MKVISRGMSMISSVKGKRKFLNGLNCSASIHVQLWCQVTAYFQNLQQLVPSCGYFTPLKLSHITADLQVVICGVKFNGKFILHYGCIKVGYSSTYWTPVIQDVWVLTRLARHFQPLASSGLVDTCANIFFIATLPAHRSMHSTQRNCVHPACWPLGDVAVILKVHI